MSTTTIADDDWHRRLIRETRALQGLSEHIGDDPVNVELAARFLTSALTPSSSDPAVAVEGGANGAAGPRDTDDGSLGKCAVVTVGRSGGNRPAAPTTKRTPPVAAGEAHDNAAVMTRREGA